MEFTRFLFRWFLAMCSTHLYGMFWCHAIGVVRGNIGGNIYRNPQPVDEQRSSSKVGSLRYGRDVRWPNGNGWGVYTFRHLCAHCR